MKESDIKSILKANPDTLFNLAYKPPKDYYGEKLWEHRVVKVQIHPRGYFTVTEHGRHVHDPSWDEHKPYRVSPRQIVKVYEHKQERP
jgi:hypothetical protein